MRGVVVTAGGTRARAKSSEELLAGPIRGELLGADHLAARARALARSQSVSSKSAKAARVSMHSTRLLQRLADTKRVLRAAHGRLQASPSEVEEAGPAAEWLLDNFHVIQEQLQEVRSSLPRGYYRELPELRSGPLTGYPRVYEIAITLISHTEARLDHANVDLFLTSFQSVSPLSIGELWAVPSMLRLALIESVRRMTLRVVERLDESREATQWAEEILAAGTQGGPELRTALRALADSDPALTPNFIARLLQLLRQVDGASPPLLWLEHWIRDAGGAPEQAIADSAQRHALTQIMMSNSITSLRNLGRRDWREFVEQ